MDTTNMLYTVDKIDNTSNDIRLYSSAEIYNLSIKRM